MFHISEAGEGKEERSVDTVVQGIVIGNRTQKVTAQCSSNGCHLRNKAFRGLFEIQILKYLIYD